MMSAKMVFKKAWGYHKGYDVITFVHDVTNKISSRDSNYTEDVISWSKFGNCSISPQFYKDLTRKTAFFWGMVVFEVQ